MAPADGFCKGHLCPNRQPKDRGLATRCFLAALLVAAIGDAGVPHLLADDFPEDFISQACPDECDDPQAAVAGSDESLGSASETSLFPRTGALSPTNIDHRLFVAVTRGERPSISLTSYQRSSSEQASAPAASTEESLPELQPLEVGAIAPIRFRDDASTFLPRLGQDALGVVNNWNNVVLLGIGLGGSLAIRSDLDGTVRNWTAEHPDRWGKGSTILSDFGEPQYQIPVILGAYAFTVWQQDAEHHDMMTSLISAYTITGLSTLAVKGIANTTRPNGNRFGFPSYHTASTFAVAAVLDEYEGHWIGVPAYILSGMVGFSRIDLRDHDLSDVVFGGVMGYVIGKSVAGKALYGNSRVHMIPYRHPLDGSPGIAMEASF